jgi:protein-S-isoprenylcysteine O-methyltransferase Ste14
MAALHAAYQLTKTSSPPRRRTLPALGRRGEGWVLLQASFLALVIIVGLWGARWPSAARPWLAIGAVWLALAGVCLLAGGCLALGRQITPFPKPLAKGSVRSDGVYGLVRHPMYGGALLLLLAWSLISSPLALLPWVLAAAFLEAKRRREEAWLVEQYAGYDTYRQQIRSRFIPLVW